MWNLMKFRSGQSTLDVRVRQVLEEALDHLGLVQVQRPLLAQNLGPGLVDHEVVVELDLISVEFLDHEEEAVDVLGREVGVAHVGQEERAHDRQNVRLDLLENQQLALGQVPCF